MIMKRLISVVFIMSLVVSVSAQQLAFPTAKGYGRFAEGGRHRYPTRPELVKVVAVTNLLDDVDNPPEGSFRWALNQGTATIIVNNVSVTVQVPMTIVFKVGGVIDLKGDIRVQKKYLTIAGETALGDGICFKGGTLNFSGSENIIVRYIRSRPGDVLREEASACRLENGSNYIFDHCSFSWGIEETTHYSHSDNFTIQWCILSEALYYSIHKKGERGYAAQWGGQYASYHHNLLAHNQSRNPRINGSNADDIEALVDYRNNVNYNWGTSGAFYGGEFENTPGCSGFAKTNVVNNYFKPGPGTSGSTFAAPSLQRSGTTFCGYAQWYFDGNVMEGNAGKTADNWTGVDAGAVGGIDNIKSTVEAVQSDGVLENYDDYTQSANDAYDSVIVDVGATLPSRDAIDDRIIKEMTGDISIVRYQHVIEGITTPVRGLTAGIIDTQKNLVQDTLTQSPWDCYQTVTSDQAPTDTDNDGMPDDWETANGLNPNDGSDFVTITASGYSNLELYLFSLTGDEVPVSTFNTKLQPVINVYPNPVMDQFSLQCSDKIKDVKLYDLFGRMVMNLTDKLNDDSINADHLMNGCYIIRAVSDNGKVVVVKLIKK